MKLAEFNRAVAADAADLKAGKTPEGVCACAVCTVPLQESITGSRRYNTGEFVCSDCYFEVIGKELDEHPILTARTVRGA